MGEYSPFGTPHSSPGGGGAPSHAQWLRRTLSGHGGESFDSSAEAWPDLLVDRRSMVERRLWTNRDPVALERNNLVSIRWVNLRLMIL
jgi:hypothetical protein